MLSTAAGHTDVHRHCSTSLRYVESQTSRPVTSANYVNEDLVNIRYWADLGSFLGVSASSLGQFRQSLSRYGWHTRRTGIWSRRFCSVIVTRYEVVYGESSETVSHEKQHCIKP